MMQNMMGMKEQMKRKMGPDFNPMEMCQRMMTLMEQITASAYFGTEEIRNLFSNWLEEIERDILIFVKSKDKADPDTIALEFNISKESAIFFLSRLAQKGKIHMDISFNMKSKEENKQDSIFISYSEFKEASLFVASKHKRFGDRRVKNLGI